MHRFEEKTLVKRKKFAYFFMLISTLLPIFSNIAKADTTNSITTANQSIINNPSVESLSFSWNMPVGMATFERSGYIWAVFDHRQNIDLKEISKDASDYIENIIQIPHSIATIIRIKPKAGVRASVRKEGLLWVLDLYKGEAPNIVKDFPIFTQYNSQKQAYLFIPTTNAGFVVSIVDPEVGDTINIAPITDTDIGISSEYNYPEFKMLPSSQGVAIISKTPEITLNRGNTGLTIRGRTRGLNISQDLDQLKRQEELAQNYSNTAGFDISISKQIFEKPFLEAEKQLLKDIANASDENKEHNKIELAKYYAAMGLGSEAMKILKEIKNNKSPIVNTEKFNALEGVTNLLLKRYEQAADNFSFGNLPDINEAIFWRTVSSLNEKNAKENNIILFSYISLIKDYPTVLKDKIALLAAENAIAANDDMSAQNFIDILKTCDNELHDHKDEIAFLTAKKLGMQGFATNAYNEYGRLTNVPSQKYSSLARYNAASLGSKASLMPLDKAISELEKLRFTWNEPKFKLNVYNELTNLYIKNRNYDKALNTLKDMYKDSANKNKKETEQRMVALFEDIFIFNQADDLPALKTIALYNDFEWLAPKSKKYNDIVQRFADRLVAVDLLPRAETILNKQLKNESLSPIERSYIGTRLALINLFMNKPDNAVLILDDTNVYGMPESLQNHRRIIRAKALERQGHIEEALDLLANDTSKNAILLKSEFYWNANRWAEAADTIKLMIEKPSSDKPLSDEQIEYIINWMTALKKAGKETVLVRIKNKFNPYFINTKYYSAFSVLTDTLEKDKIDLATIGKTVNDVKAFSNFTKIYNNSLMNKGLSKTIE